ncbi:alpha/beta fold hydrolase [Halobacillus sp. H74]|uniref:alpha/beta fold hydrolase n=1 Tax=Halobacillus sp. H74 TaxID=3457436 RepID=UPI003FCCDF87
MITMMKGKGIPLNYEAHINDRRKEWIVFFHGFGGNHTIFNRQISHFKEDYNLLFVDLPGHGKSPDFTGEENVLAFTSKKVIELLDQVGVRQAHLVGVSLGTIVMQDIATKFPERIKSMVLSGAVGKWLWWGEALGKFTLTFPVRSLLPYMIPFVTFAYIVLPKKNHKKSRDVFIKEALKLGKSSYINWLFTVKDAHMIYRTLRKQGNRIPKLYISGEEDHMFLKGITTHVRKEKEAELLILKECGHVCNIEKYPQFNQHALKFFESIDNEVLKRKLEASSGL